MSCVKCDGEVDPDGPCGACRDEKYSDLLQSHHSLCYKIEVQKEELKSALLQNREESLRADANYKNWQEFVGHWESACKRVEAAERHVGELQKQLADKEQQRLGAHKAWMDLNNEEQKTAHENRDLKHQLTALDREYSEFYESSRKAAEEMAKCHLAMKERADVAERLNQELQKKLRTAQTVINKHVADQVEGLHCVNCTADADEICDCPMLVPIFEVMEGYENCAHANIEAVGEGFRRCKDCGEMEPPYAKKPKCEHEWMDGGEDETAGAVDICKKCGISFHQVHTEKRNEGQQIQCTCGHGGFMKGLHGINCPVRG